MESPSFEQIPFESREHRTGDRARTRGETENGPGLDCRVLVVEDDDATLEAVAELLEGEGVSVCKARNGREALELLQQGSAPGLIIVDLMMPVMDGWELCRRIAADEGLAGIPIAIVTAAAAIDRMPVRRNDAGFFTKPVDYRQLLEVVRRYSR
jgi:two-component system, chemotaxis family, chemotaxis protein CheY